MKKKLNQKRKPSKIRASAPLSAKPKGRNHGTQGWANERKTFFSPHSKKGSDSLLKFAFTTYLLVYSDLPARQVVEKLNSLEIETARGFRKLLEAKRDELLELRQREEGIRKDREALKLNLIRQAARKTLKRKYPKGLLANLLCYA